MPTAQSYTCGREIIEIIERNVYEGWASWELSLLEKCINNAVVTPLLGARPNCIAMGLIKIIKFNKQTEVRIILAIQAGPLGIVGDTCSNISPKNTQQKACAIDWDLLSKKCAFDFNLKYTSNCTWFVPKNPFRIKRVEKEKQIPVPLIPLPVDVPRGNA